MSDIEELIDLVLTGQHPKLRERCIVDRIVSVLEDKFGAFDANGVRAVLANRSSTSASTRARGRSRGAWRAS